MNQYLQGILASCPKLFWLPMLIVLASAVFVFKASVAKGQSENRKTLEKERAAIMNRIRSTHLTLKRTRETRAQELDRLAEINSQIYQKNALVSVLQKELRLIEKSVQENASIVEALEADLKSIKNEYKTMLYAAYKSSGKLDRLAYVFAANSLNQFLARVHYFKIYDASRKEQFSQISRVQAMLTERKTELEQQKLSKQQLLALERHETVELSSLQGAQKSVIGELKSKESEMQQKLGAEQESLKEMEKLIAESIKAAAFSASLTPEERKLSASFVTSKKRIPWPVSNGFISGRFGLQAFGDDKDSKLKIEKLGIDIRTSANEAVRSVFAGKVVDVSEIPGRGYMVIIQHGDYFTVYARLKNVQVQIGQKIKAKENIAQAGLNPNNLPEIEFQIWRHQTKLDPEQWLIK